MTSSPAAGPRSPPLTFRGGVGPAPLPPRLRRQARARLLSIGGQPSDGHRVDRSTPRDGHRRASAARAGDQDQPGAPTTTALAGELGEAAEEDGPRIMPASSEIR